MSKQSFTLYKVLLTREAEKQLISLDRRYQRAIVLALRRLGENPNIGESLRHELKGKFRLRVSKYRIIYQVDHKAKTIWILNIEHRKDVYR
jgi:mRNA interferase RelE/StbE